MSPGTRKEQAAQRLTWSLYVVPLERRKIFSSNTTPNKNICILHNDKRNEWEPRRQERIITTIEILNNVFHIYKYFNVCNLLIIILIIFLYKRNILLNVIKQKTYTLNMQSLKLNKNYRTDTEFIYIHSLCHCTSLYCASQILHFV